MRKFTAPILLTLLTTVLMSDSLILSAISVGHAKSEEMGREFFEDVPFVKVILPGLRGEEIDRKASDEDKTCWPAQWEAFQNKQEQPISGTPLEACSLIKPSEIAGLPEDRYSVVSTRRSPSRSAR